MPKMYVFQHVPYENLGSLEAAFRKRGVDFEYIQSFRDVGASANNTRRTPLPGDASGLIFMGGPMSANDDFDFIHHELRMMEAALKKNIPMLGICLGSQMLAKVLGGRVYPGKQKEIGWYPLQMKAAAGSDPLLKNFPKELTIFQWHGETFELPKEAIPLATSELYPQQAFRYGSHVYGLQFHPEMTLPMIYEWIEMGKSEMEAAGLSENIPQIFEKSPQHLRKLNSLIESLADGWVDLLP